jgi:hypothetical protein
MPSEPQSQPTLSEPHATTWKGSDSEPEWRGLAISATVHALALAAITLLLPAPPARHLPRPESIVVELIDVPPPSAAAPTVAVPDAPPATLQRVPPPVAAPLPTLAHAQTLLSGAALDPRARAELRRLALPARFEQLCDVEAMEQVAKSQPHFKPERAIAYLTANTTLEGDTLTATGAAFLSEGHWYRLAFKCRTTTDRQKVVSFDFAIGEQIPDDDPRLPIGASD